MDTWIPTLLHALALPQYGLSTVFLVSFLSATLLPLGSEPVVFGMLHLRPDMAAMILAIATTGNTLGGGVNWGLGRAARRVYQDVRHQEPNTRARRWVERWGTKACLLSWLPVVGDPLCSVAGFMKLPFWPCLGYMALGKGGRYLILWWMLRAL